MPMYAGFSPTYNPLANLPGPLSGSAGRAAYGAVPSAVALPANRYTQAGQVYSGLNKLTGGLGDTLTSWSQGYLSPAETNAAQDIIASRGISAGIPGFGDGSMLSNKLALWGAQTAGQRQRDAISAYPSFLSSLESGMTDPNLAWTNDVRSSDLAAAPDPTAAANRQLELYNAYLRSTTGAVPNGGGQYTSIAPPAFQANRASGGTGRYNQQWNVPFYGQGNYGKNGTSPYQVWNMGGFGQYDVPAYDGPDAGAWGDIWANPTDDAALDPMAYMDFGDFAY